MVIRKEYIKNEVERVPRTSRMRIGYKTRRKKNYLKRKGKIAMWIKRFLAGSETHLSCPKKGENRSTMDS